MIHRSLFGPSTTRAENQLLAACDRFCLTPADRRLAPLGARRRLLVLSMSARRCAAWALRRAASAGASTSCAGPAASTSAALDARRARALGALTSRPHSPEPSWSTGQRRRRSGVPSPHSRDGDPRPTPEPPTAETPAAADDVWNFAGFLRDNPKVTSTCLTTGLLMAGHSCVAPVLPLFAGELGATAAQVGMTLSAFAAARLVLNVPCGILADRRGRRPLVVVGPLVTAVGMLGSAASQGLPELFAWRFIAGAGSAVYMSGAQAMLADISTPANRARVLGANQAAVLAGAAAGPAFGGIMAGALELGCRSPFLAVAALCGVAAVNAHRNAPETLHKAREEAEAARAIGAAANGCPADESAEATRDASKSASSEYAHTASERAGGEAHLTSSEVELDASTRATDAHADADARSTLSLFSSRDFLAVSGLNAALFFSGAGGRATLLPLLAAQEFGYTPAALGVMFSGMAATSMLGVLPGAAVGDKHGRSALIFPCVAASAAAVATTGSTTNHEVFVASAFAWAGAHSLMGPAPAAYAADVTPPSIRGTALSVYRTCGDVGLLVGPVALGALADHTSVGTALVANGAVLAGAAGAFRLTARRTARRIDA